jgi:hypothetical protein
VRRPPDDYTELEWLAFKTRETHRRRSSTFRRFIHNVLGLCFR